MHHMHKPVKRKYACHAWDVWPRVWQFPKMPPVKKNRDSERGQTFLKQWREAKSLTLEQAAERIDVHYTTLMRIERGKVPYNQDFLEAAARAYGCQPADLLATDPAKPLSVPQLVFEALKNAPNDKQAEALRFVTEYLLKGA